MLLPAPGASLCLLSIPGHARLMPCSGHSLVSWWKALGKPPLLQVREEQHSRGLSRHCRVRRDQGKISLSCLQPPQPVLEVSPSLPSPFLLSDVLISAVGLTSKWLANIFHSSELIS